MGFIFRAHVVAPSYQEPDSRDAACKANMLALWTNFVKTGSVCPLGPCRVKGRPARHTNKCNGHAYLQGAPDHKLMSL